MVYTLLCSYTTIILEKGAIFLDIRLDDLTGYDIKNLLIEHLKDMHLNSPAESVHALTLEQLRQPQITFWSAWEGKDLLGCGALKELDLEHGEVKSMRTSSMHLRKGVAKQLLQHIIVAAKSRGYRRLSLETGSRDAFEPARRLYKCFGFQYCKPFAEYNEDPNCVYMTMEL